MMFLITLLATVYGHGRLLTPATRVGHNNYENDPTGSSGNGGNNNNAWVCRHANRNTAVPYTSITAGTSVNLVWYFGAKHVGDCDAYISYDTDLALGEMQWFKIGNFFDCRQDSDSSVNHPIQMPSFLPEGNAVLRWGWYALHQYPNVEFYSQCADITIVNQGVTQLPSNVAKYKLIGDNPIFPLTANDGVGYSNRFPPAQDWMTGPPCAAGIPSTVNDCWRTAKGTTGYIDVEQDDTVVSTTSTTTSSGSGSTAPPISTSTQRCGLDWVDANSKCGTDCPSGTDSECPTGEKCFRDLTITCADIGVNTACTTWIKLDSRPAIPDDWCQLTCTNAATKEYCDSDACKCQEIALDNGQTFSLADDCSFAPLLISFFAAFVAMVQF